MTVTALAPHIGYDNAAKIAKKALKNNSTLKQEALNSGLIDEKMYDLLINPKKDDYSIIRFENSSLTSKVNF